MARSRGFELLHALSGRPERTWPDAVLHHGARVLLLVALALSIHALFPVTPVPDVPVVEKGMVAEQDVIAQVAFPIYKTGEELARERAEAAAAVPPVFRARAEAADSMQLRVERFMSRFDADRGPVSEAEARDLLRDYGLSVPEGAVALLRDARSRAVLERSLHAAIRRGLAEGVASSAELEGLSQLRVRTAAGERLLPRDSVRAPQEFFSTAPVHLPAGADPDLVELQRTLLIRFFEPTLRVDTEATEAARARAQAAVPTVKADVLKGERIIGANERVQDEDLQRLAAYREHLTRLGARGDGRSSRLRALGGVLFNLFPLLVFGMLVFLYRRPVYDELRHVSLIAFLVLALAAASAIIARFDAPFELVPIAVPVLVVAALWDGRMALHLGLLLAILLSGQTPLQGMSVLFSLVLGGAAAALCVRAVRRRSQTWAFALIIAAAYVAAAVTMGLLRSRAPIEILWSAAWGVLNGGASALIAMGFLPLFEAFARITTHQTLLELTDLNRPLLQRLSREAPGTFAHSISVANLAEAAARSIGANALLARVGSYYHDVGKVAKAQYFIENQPPGRNPHDRLKPGTSAGIVRNHIQEGLRLADEHKVPSSIKAFIAEHHGTQPITYFLERAREAEPTASLDTREFFYPGPRPRSAETAIVMLADSVESASRVVQDPTPARIRALVDRVVDGKVALGQLDEAPLTLGQLSRLKETFVTILSGMYHQRIDYPAGGISGAGMAAVGATAERD